MGGEKPADPSKYRAFALGIKDNTVKDMERNVVSEYALTFGLPGDKTVGKLDFTVNDVDAGIIQNRATLPTLGDKDAKEYEWLNKVDDEPIFEGADKNVKEGDKVETKEKIGRVYYDAEESKSELQFQVWKSTTKQNPEYWIAK